jgi:phosphoserine phosphatase RsbU/P
MDHTIDNAPCGYVTFDDDGVVLEVNRTLTAMLGYERTDIEGQPFEKMLTVANRIFYQTHFFPLLRLHGKAEEIFLTLRSKSGAHVPVLANAARREDAATFVNVCVVIPVMQRQKYEEEILHAKRTAEEALNNNEELTTAKKELEQRAHELDRKISLLKNKNDELITLASVLSHDLREPARKISVFQSLLQRDHLESLTPSGRRLLEQIGAESIQTTQLLQTLEQYISLDTREEKSTHVDLNAVLKRARKQVERFSPDTLTLRSGHLPTIEGYESQLEVMFFNLIENAVKFAQPEVPLEVTVECTTLQSNSFSAIEGKYRYVDFARITLSDNGIGFEPRYGEYVFKMLTQIDKRTPGLGNGLAICRKVVSSHLGSITVKSRPGEGTTFTIMLPTRQ